MATQRSWATGGRQGQCNCRKLTHPSGRETSHCPAPPAPSRTSELCHGHVGHVTHCSRSLCGLLCVCAMCCALPCGVLSAHNPGHYAIVPAPVPAPVPSFVTLLLVTIFSNLQILHCRCRKRRAPGPWRVARGGRGGKGFRAGRQHRRRAGRRSAPYCEWCAASKCLAMQPSGGSWFQALCVARR